MSSKHIIMPVCWPLIKFFWERKKKGTDSSSIFWEDVLPMITTLAMIESSVRQY